MTSVTSHPGTLPLYLWYEMQQAGLEPFRLAAAAMRIALQSAANPARGSAVARSVAAGCELFERTTRRYDKPAWGISSTIARGEAVAIEPQIVWQRPFCRLVHFARGRDAARQSPPKILLVAPMSGHHATLLRGTVETLLPEHDVYVTDWTDARLVPISEGRFDLDDYVDYLISMIEVLHGGCHVVAVCQSAVPALAAVAVMEARNDPNVPHSMVLLGGPIDPRSGPTAVNRLAEEKGIAWFRNNVIHPVPLGHPGALRAVYPGFLQLGGFMSMNLDRHVSAHRDMFLHLVRGDGDSAQRHREFYDEYLAVMDLTAEFYLQTVETVFIDHALPRGAMRHRGSAVEPDRIRRCALMTVEGELDDITGPGQTEAAHRLCPRIPRDRKMHYVQPGVGHYGVFNGSRFRSEIAPRIAAFVRAAEARGRHHAIAPRPGLLDRLQRAAGFRGDRRATPATTASAGAPAGRADEAAAA